MTHHFFRASYLPIVHSYRFPFPAFFLTNLPIAPLTYPQIMFNLEKAHFILDEMVMNGEIVETNKPSILKPIQLMEKASKN
jgi:hypothetical protein